MKPRYSVVRSVLLSACAALALLTSACGSSSEQASDNNLSQEQTAARVAPAPTKGCSLATSTQTPGSSETKTIKVGGTSRSFVVHLPRNYDSSKPLPVVLDFHGMGSNGLQQMLVSGISHMSDQKNFIAIAPNAVDGLWKISPEGGGSVSSEIAFLKAMTNYIDNNYCVDGERVYSMGMSQGSAMTFILACAPDAKIAAFGGVGATFYRPVCSKSAPAPIIYFHGTQDAIVPINGGKTPGGQIEPTIDSLEGWARHNACGEEATETTNNDVTTYNWTGCENGADIIYHRITDGGHTWPGADSAIAGFMEASLGKTTQTVSATSAMWEFFEQHTMSQRLGK